MPKKQQRNAFYFFMKDLEPQLRREGRVFPNGMADVVPIAHPRWKDLPAKERERYEKMAKDFKAKMRGVDGDKYRMDNQGTIVAFRRDETQELANYFTRMAKEVRSSWPPGRDVMHESFFIVNIQTLCETEEGEFLPCEIALLEFSLQNGIIKTFHKFIEPGRIPLGYAFTCKDKSEQTHQIPWEHFELADADYGWIWMQMKNFINPNQEKSVYPPVYCRPSVYKETKYCLEWLHRMALERGTCQLGKLLNLEILLMDLFAHLGKSISKTVAVDILGSNSYDFVEGHLCKFHEEKECKYCSLGILRRYAYSMFDELAEICDMDLTTNHLPPRSENTLPITVIPPPKTSIFPQQPINRGPTYSQLANQGKSRREERGAVFASRDYRYAHLDKTDSEEDEDRDAKESEGYTSLRLPKTTGPAPAWGQSPAPSIGRGMSILNVQGATSSVPLSTTGPHVGGLQTPNTSLSSGEPHLGGLQRTLPTPNMQGLGRSAVRPSLMSSVGMPVGRGAQFAGVQPMPRPVAPTTSIQHDAPALAARGCGRGVLGPLPVNNPRVKLPVGRGLAPPALMESFRSELAALSTGGT